MKRPLVLAPFLALALAAAPLRADEPSPSPATDDGAFVQGEKSVETRLLAPCCWNGTLDVHESDLARDLRKEIRARLRAGESVDAVEAAMIERFGDRVRAAPQHEHVGVLLGVGVLALLAVAGLLLKRSVRTAAPSPAAPRGEGARDAWDDRLDEELELRRARLRATS